MSNLEGKASMTGLALGAPIRSLVPTDFDQVARLAKMACIAGLFKGSEEQGLAQATMAILQGMECGIPPMQAIQQIAVINGRCTIWGDLVPALIWKNGHKIKEWIEGDGDKRIAHCEITRGDSGDVISRTFSVQQAKLAGLWGKAGPWKQYEDRMLQMRARGFCSRDAVPDVLRGMYLREEAEDQERVANARDITPKAAPALSIVPPPAPKEENFGEPVKHLVHPDGAEEFVNVVSNLEADLMLAHTEANIDEIWQEHMEAVCSLGHDDRAKADELYETHMSRVKAFEVNNAA